MTTYLLLSPVRPYLIDLACFFGGQLHSIVLGAAGACVVNGPSEEQKEKVRRLERVESVRRRQEKEKRSAVKRGRSTAAGHWD